MRALKARVKGGRLVLDEPTNLPEGAEVRVALVDDERPDGGGTGRTQTEIGNC